MTTGMTHPPADTITPRSIDMEAPWRWMAKGWGDFTKAWPYSLTYGLVFVGIGMLIFGGLSAIGWSAAIPVGVGGFALLGPLLAVGLYEISRRLTEGEPLTIRDIAFVRTAAPGQMAMVGFLLAFLFMVWIRMAQLLLALFTHGESFGSLDEFANYAFSHRDGLTLLVMGTIIGGFIAFAVFAISAVSVPILMRRNVDVITAIIASFDAIRRHPGPMILWAWIIAITVAVGSALALVGLAIAFPVLGHATWHAYRDLIEPKSPLAASDSEPEAAPA